MKEDIQRRGKLTCVQVKHSDELVFMSCDQDRKSWMSDDLVDLGCRRTILKEKERGREDQSS